MPVSKVELSRIEACFLLRFAHGSLYWCFIGLKASGHRLPPTGMVFAFHQHDLIAGMDDDEHGYRAFVYWHASNPLCKTLLPPRLKYGDGDSV